MLHTIVDVVLANSRLPKHCDGGYDKGNIQRQHFGTKGSKQREMSQHKHEHTIFWHKLLSSSNVEA